MKELIEWLAANKIQHKQLDSEVVYIPSFGKMYFNDTSKMDCVFRVNPDTEETEFVLADDEDLLQREGINYVAYKFGDNFYYYDIRKGFDFKLLKYVGERVPCQSDIEYVNLGVHTPYELLNSVGAIEWWVKKAKYMGHKAIGICDHNTMAGTLNLQKACASSGIKHIFGYSFEAKYVSDGEELIVPLKVYVLNEDGLASLLRIQKIVAVDGEEEAIEERTAKMGALQEYGKGLALVFATQSIKWVTQHWDDACKLMACFDKVYYQFDVTEMYVPRTDDPIFESLNHFILNYYNKEKDEFKIKPILICDSYFLDEGEEEYKRRLASVGKTPRDRSYYQYFKDIDELKEMFENLFDDTYNTESMFRVMCASTMEIAESEGARFEMERNFMPQYDMTEEEKRKYGTRHNMFLQLIKEGFERLVPKGKEDIYRERLAEEIYVLESTDNVDYMLVQYDTVNWARRNGILVGAGRGSAGGCLVLYLLGITMVDPIKFNLLFERFLLPERGGLEQTEVTITEQKVRSKNCIEIEFENGVKRYFSKKSEVLVNREGEDKPLRINIMDLREGDDIIFDNRDLIWEMNDQD